MYSLPYFKEKDPEVVRKFIHDHPFAMLIGNAEGFPVATQIPLLIHEKQEKLFFSGHIMRNTDHHKAFIRNPHVLCVFTGPHTYVSGSWYSDPHTASTWNYMSVHVKGILRFVEEQGLRQILHELTLYFEKGNTNSPTIYDNLSEEYVDKLIKAIIGFEIEVAETDNVFKLSQNRDEKSYGNIIEKLEQQDEQAKQIASEMKCRFAIYQKQST